MTPIELFLIGWSSMATIMIGIWFLQRSGQNAAIVDVAWAAGVGGLAVFFAYAADGDQTRRIVLAALAGIWSIRLTGHLYLRVVGEPEDGRYVTLKEAWQPNVQRNLFFFFQLQAFWAVMFAAPVLAAAGNRTPGLVWFDFLGIAIWSVAIIGEGIADRQLAQFKTNSSQRGEVCRRGLWGWSRHPNYFFEWLHWWTYVLVGVGAPWFYLTFAGPAVMLYFLLKVTGIPYTEAQAIKSRGDAYRKYQAEVSSFVPWPPGKGQQS